MSARAGSVLLGPVRTAKAVSAGRVLGPVGRQMKSVCGGEKGTGAKSEGTGLTTRHAQSSPMEKEGAWVEPGWFDKEGVCQLELGQCCWVKRGRQGCVQSQGRRVEISARGVKDSVPAH